MSLNELLLNQVKPWCNLRINNLVTDGYSINESSVVGLTGGSNPANAQGNHQYVLSGFTGGANLTLGSVSPDGQVLDFVVGATMAGACTIVAGGGILNGTILGNTGNKVYISATQIVVGTTAKIGDKFQLRSANSFWSVNGIVQAGSAYT